MKNIALLAPASFLSPDTPIWSNPIKLLKEELIYRGYKVSVFSNCYSTSIGIKGFSHLTDNSNKFDIIHNHFGFLPLIYSGLINTPIVSTIYRQPVKEVMPIYEQYNNKVYYISISNFDKSKKLSYTSTIYNGVELSNFTFNKNHGQYLLFISYDSDVTNLLDAIYIAEQSNIKLVIAYYNQQYFNTHIKPNINGKQVNCYKLSDPKLKNKLIEEALALLLPIKYNIKYNNIDFMVAESFACGTPIIAYRYGILSELVDNGITGYLVNTIEEAISMVSQVRSISRSRCREEAEVRFSKKQMVDKYINLYNKILEENKQESHRPWGYYEVISSKDDHKVKRIFVNPNKRLSLQRHKHRAEHWYIVKGKAIATLDNNEIPLETGDAIDIPKGIAHRISNDGKETLIFIEVQTGVYFGEDDIERLEDDFGRN